jgi:hypothetical protein
LPAANLQLKDWSGVSGQLVVKLSLLKKISNTQITRDLLMQRAAWFIERHS